MITLRQTGLLSALAAVFWIVAVEGLELDPEAVQPGWRGDLSFVISLPVAWLCVRLARRIAKLAPHQLVTATALVVALDTLLDAGVLRWAPKIYGADPSGRTLSAAWLLWGYGASLMAALVMTLRPVHQTNRPDSSVQH